MSMVSSLKARLYRDDDRLTGYRVVDRCWRFQDFGSLGCSATSLRLGHSENAWQGRTPSPILSFKLATQAEISPLDSLPEPASSFKINVAHRILETIGEGWRETIEKVYVIRIAAISQCTGGSRIHFAPGQKSGLDNRQVKLFV